MDIAGLRTGKSLKKSRAIQPPQLKPDPLTVMTVLAAAPEELDLYSLGINVDLSGPSLDEEEGLDAFPEPIALGDEIQVLGPTAEDVLIKPPPMEAKGLIFNAVDALEPELVKENAFGRRRIVLFFRSRLLPTITIKLKPKAEGHGDIPSKNLNPLPPNPDSSILKNIRRGRIELNKNPKMTLTSKRLYLITRFRRNQN